MVRELATALTRWLFALTRERGRNSLFPIADKNKFTERAERPILKARAVGRALAAVTSIGSVGAAAIAATLAILPQRASAQANTFADEFTIEGRLYDASGNPLNQSAVSVMFELVSEQDQTCVLYREVFSPINVSSHDTTSQGVFALRLGSGSMTYPVSPASKPSFYTLFTPGSFTGDSATSPGTPCSVSATAGEHRYVRVSVQQGSTVVASAWDTLSPNTRLTAVPTATIAQNALQLQGLGTASLIIQDGVALTQSNVANIFSSSNYGKLLTLLAGTSPQYLSSAPTAPVDFNGQTLTNLGAPVNTGDAATKLYVDTTFGGKALNLSSVGTATASGTTLLWNATTTQWQAGMPVDSTKLPLAGGTMSGALNMGGNNIANLGVLGLGLYTNATQATLTAAFGTANTGSTWFNTTNGSLEIWNGSAAVQQAYLDGGGKLSPTWIPNTSVVASTYGSSAHVPVFTVGADGRITSATTVAISGVAPNGTAAGDLSGFYPAPSIAAGAVTTAKIGNDSITSAKINSTGIGINQLVATDSTSGSGLTYFTCPLPNQIIAWNAGTGWTCTTVASLAPVASVAGKTGAVTLNAMDVSGLGLAATKDYGSAAGNLVQLDGSGRLPAVDGSQLTNITSTTLQGRAVSSTLPSVNQVLQWNGSQWQPSFSSAGTVTNVTAGSGLTGGSFTAAGTLAVNVGTGAAQIPQLNSNAQLALGRDNAASPTYSFSGNTGSGLYGIGTNSIGLAANGSAVVTITGSNGYMGLGVTSPADNFDVFSATNGQMGIGVVTSGSGNNQQATISIETKGNGSNQLGTLTTTKGWQFYGNGDSYVGGAGLANDLGLSFYDGANWREAFHVTSAGKVGIATMTPGAAFEVYGTGTLYSAMIVPRDTTANRPSAGVNGMIRYNTNLASLEAYANGNWQTLASGGGGGTVTSVAAGAGLVGGPITSTGTLSVNMGTAPGQIPQLNANAQLLLGNGNGAKPALSFANNTSAGLFYDPVSNMLDIAAANGTAVQVNVNTGWVGIGSSSPMALLSVWGGDVQITNSGASPRLSVMNLDSPGVTAQFPQLDLYNFMGAVGLGFPRIQMFNFRGSNGNASPVQTGDVLMSIDAIGGSGTGTSWSGNSSARIIVTAADNFTSTAGGGNISFYTTQAGSTNSFERLRISSLGLIGVGTAAPGALLDVNGTGAYSAVIVPRDTSANRPTTPVNGMIRYNLSTNSLEGYVGGSWMSIATYSSGGLLMTGTGLTGGPITSNGTISVNVGTGALQIVQEGTAGQILQSRGTTSMPTYSFVGDTSTGMYSPGLNKLSLVAGTPGSAQFSIVYSNTGTSYINVTSALNSVSTLIDPAITGTTAQNWFSTLYTPPGSTSNPARGMVSQLNFNSTYNTTQGDLRGFEGQVIQNSPYSLANAQGVVGYVKNSSTASSGSVSLQSAVALTGNVENSAVSDINSATGGYFLLNNYNSGTIWAGYGVAIGTPVNTGSGSIRNAVGLYIYPQTAATVTNYAIYSAGGTNYFAGNVGIGTTLPSVALDVAGSASVDQTMVANHFAGKSNAPIVALGNGAGTGPTSLVATGSDVALNISFKAGTTPSAGYPIFTWTFGTSYGSVPACVFSPFSNASASISGTSAVYGSASASAFTLYSNSSSGIPASGNYAWAIHCIQ